MTLLAFGEPEGYTAMAKTVGLPVAIAAQLIVQGRIKGAGVVGPFDPAVYEPILEHLSQEGITLMDSSVFL